MDLMGRPGITAAQRSLFRDGTAQSSGAAHIRARPVLGLPPAHADERVPLVSETEAGGRTAAGETRRRLTGRRN
jgi:hypothetical protein